MEEKNESAVLMYHLNQIRAAGGTSDFQSDHGRLAPNDEKAGNGTSASTVKGEDMIQAQMKNTKKRVVKRKGKLMRKIMVVLGQMPWKMLKVVLQIQSR